MLTHFLSAIIFVSIMVRNEKTRKKGPMKEGLWPFWTFIFVQKAKTNRLFGPKKLQYFDVIENIIFSERSKKHMGIIGITFSRKISDANHKRQLLMV